LNKDPRIDSPSGYIPTLDGWRAMAVLGVIAYHGAPPGAHVIAALAGQGFRGVDVFFGISGFLICSKLIEEHKRTGSISLKHFYSRRAFRILPPAFAYLAIVGMLGALRLLASMPPAEWLSCLLFFRNYMSASVTASGYTGHYWSLSVEEHFYLLLPGALLLLGPRRARVAIPLLAIAVAAWRAYDAHAMLIEHWWPTEARYHRTDVRVDELLWGAALPLALTHRGLRDWLNHSLSIWAWAAIVFCYVAVAAKNPPLSRMVEGILVPLILLGTILNSSSAIGRFLEHRVVRWLGRISYSLYLWQSIFFTGRYHEPSLLQTFPLNAIVLLCVATASYYLVERPMIALGHRLSRAGEDRRAPDVLRPGLVRRQSHIATIRP